MTVAGPLAITPLTDITTWLRGPLLLDAPTVMGVESFESTR